MGDMSVDSWTSVGLLKTESLQTWRSFRQAYRRSERQGELVAQSQSAGLRCKLAILLLATVCSKNRLLQKLFMVNERSNASCRNVCLEIVRVSLPVARRRVLKLLLDQLNVRSLQTWP